MWKCQVSTLAFITNEEEGVLKIVTQQKNENCRSSQEARSFDMKWENLKKSKAKQITFFIVQRRVLLLVCRNS